MKLYELITPSDPITFYAPDNDIAEAVALFVGNGKAGLRAVDNSEVPSTITIFGGAIDEQLERLKTAVDNRQEEIIAAGKTFAVCTPVFREEYDELTENSTNAERVERWDNKHRSSMSNWCGFARSLKFKTPSPNVQPEHLGT